MSSKSIELAIVVGIIFLAPGAGARGPTEEVINACVHNRSGIVRIVRDPSNCRRRERHLSWNVVGPAGPAGAPGASAIGNTSFLVSTGSVVAFEAEPAIVIPGLGGLIEVAEGSRVLVQLDVREWTGCPDFGGADLFGTKRSRVEILLDGEPVATREFAGEVGALSNVQSHTLVGMSEPLEAGAHSVEATLVAIGSGGNPTTTCLGAPVDDGNQARLSAIELRTAPE